MTLNPYQSGATQREQSKPVRQGLLWGEIMVALAIKFLAGILIVFAQFCILFAPMVLVGPRAAFFVDAAIDSGYFDIVTYVGWFIAFETGIFYLSRRVESRRSTHAIAYSMSLYFAVFLSRLAQWRFDFSWQSLAYYSLLIPASLLGMSIATRFRRDQRMPDGDLG